MTVRGLVTLAVALLLSTACSGSKETKLRIEVGNGVGKRTFELRCDPPAGSVPRPARLCSTIQVNRDAMLEPVEARAICIGGLGTTSARVTGSFRDRKVDFAASECQEPGSRGARLWINGVDGHSEIICAQPSEFSGFASRSVCIADGRRSEQNIMALYVRRWFDGKRMNPGRRPRKTSVRCTVDWAVLPFRGEDVYRCRIDARAAVEDCFAVAAAGHEAGLYRLAGCPTDPAPTSRLLTTPP